MLVLVILFGFVCLGGLVLAGLIWLCRRVNDRWYDWNWRQRLLCVSSGLVVITAPHFALESIELRSLRGELPEKLGVTEVIASSSSGFFMEGCASVLYRLEPGTTNTLLMQREAFFRDIKAPRNRSPDNPYSEWMETPLPVREDNRILAVRAIGGCEKDGSDFRARGIERALRAPGSFYAITSNREGMILVAPEAGLAAFLYFG